MPKVLGKNYPVRMAALEVHENAFVFSVIEFPREPTRPTWGWYPIRNFGTQTFTCGFWGLRVERAARVAALGFAVRRG